MLGHEYVTKWTRNFMAGANNFPNDEIGLGDLSLGTPITPTSSENYDDKTHNNRREIYHADGAYFCSSGTYAYVFQAISQ